ncbi:ATPase [Streptomyces sp. PRh5]|uniref:ATP-binding protein n=1 Tax=Streptomyces sp. PRh5 TaxID=1158056 RepID=UPI00044E8BDF|nr:ATP-binding protein [Streptomyces sp. PRh5]EXU69379.1 ATPase [Streptomyces sp. PRh5]
MGTRNGRASAAPDAVAEGADATEGADAIDGADATEGADAVASGDATESADAIAGADATEGADTFAGGDSDAGGDAAAGGDFAAGAGSSAGTGSSAGAGPFAAGPFAAGPIGVEDGQALAAAVQAVLARVDAHARRATATANGSRPSASATRDTATVDDPNTPATAARPPHTEDHAQAIPGPAALDALAACFGLSTFERQLVLLAAAAELDPTAAARCAAASGDPARAYPTFSLALAALDEPHWSALTPVSPLRRWRLVDLDEETRLTTSRLRIDERVLHFLAGSPYLDARLHGLLRRAQPPRTLPPSYDRAADQVAAGWNESRPEAPLRVELVGGDLTTRTDIAAEAARRTGLALYVIPSDDVPTDAAERDRLARLWQREAVLLPAALLLEVGEPDREQTAATEAFIEAAAVPLVVSSEDPRRTGRPRGERVTVPGLDDSEQLALWTDAFADVPRIEEAHLRSLVAQFQLPPHIIRSAAAAVRRDLTDVTDVTDAPLDPAELAWRAGLTEARIGLDELGRRIEPEAAWDDLVLADHQARILREIVAHVRQRATVHQEWGFAATLRRGLGVTALFAGGSGTGKTLAAEVMAKELGLDLFVIDLSQVVSKYIGETEKNLRKVFDAAERGGALLLFDEADALFGKRSEVKDSHDRYANLEVSYLLMRMEAYRGLAILTTNMKKALDPAFMRRIRFVVDFPFPGESERAEIWRRVLPARAPTKDIDPERLAQLTVAGGSIRNIALSGAFLAAEEGDRLQMRHMLAAARTEYQKLDRSLTPSEVTGWV